MPQSASGGEPRTFEFEPTAAVSTARAHSRFVRCAACSMVYVNPAREHVVNYFDIDAARPFTNTRDRDLLVRDFARLLGWIEADYLRVTGKPLERTLLIGRFLREFRDLPEARRIGLDLVEVS